MSHKQLLSSWEHYRNLQSIWIFNRQWLILCGFGKKIKDQKGYGKWLKPNSLSDCLPITFSFAWVYHVLCTALLLKLWSMNWQHHLHLGAWTLTPDVLSQNLHFNRLPCTLKQDKQWPGASESQASRADRSYPSWSFHYHVH